MAYTDVITVATGDTWTAANHNTYIRDNFAAGVPAIFAAAGDIAYASGVKAASRLASTGAARKPLRMNSGETAPEWAFGGNPVAKAILGSNQSIPNTTYTTVQFTDEEIDTDGFINLGTHNTRITIPSGMGGNYLIVANAKFAAYNGTKVIDIAKNGGSLSEQFQIYPEGAVSGCLIAIAALIAGDYLELFVFQGSGGAQNLTSASLAVVMI